GCALRLLVQAGSVREQPLRVEPCDLLLGRPVGDDEPRARVPDPEDEILVAQHLRARDRDGAELEQGEHDRMPLGRLAHEDEHAVAWSDSSYGQVVGPLRRPRVDLGEAQIAPLAVARQEHQRRAGPRLDDVAGEVEPLRDVPGAHGRRATNTYSRLSSLTGCLSKPP